MRMLLIAAVLCGLATATSMAADDVPPLTEEQIGQIRDLVHRTQAEQASLKASLAEAQQQLAECYAVFGLDLPRVTALQQQIVVLQQQLLASHHTLHTELRVLVGPERFGVLSRRIENALRSPPPSKSP